MTARLERLRTRRVAGRTAPDGRSRVLVVAQAWPAHGGIATFAETIVGDPIVRERFDLVLLNTTRRAVRRGGAVSLANVWHALQDAVRVFRAGRRASVVHLQTALLPVPPLLRALAMCGAARLAGAAVLCHVHTGQANRGPNEEFVPSRLERWLLGLLSFADLIVTVSSAGTEGLRPLVRDVPIEQVDNAVDVRAFDRADPARRPPTVLFVGTLARRKGLLDLADAASILRERGVVDWRLEVVGSGAEAGAREEATVREALQRAGREDALVGPLSGAALRARLQAASVYVLPSHTEGQPIGILEAMASGLPVVACRVGAVPQLVRDEVEGLLVDPGRPLDLATALGRLLDSDELRASMGAAGRRRAEERFDLPVLRSRLEAVYGEVVRLHAGGIGRSRPGP